MPHPSDTRDDIALLDRMIARDQTALGELYDRHSPLLYGLILRIVHDRTDAEDVLQEIFVQVWTRAHTYDVALGSPIGWLVRIARNRAIDRLRANRVRAGTAEAVGPEPVAADNPEASANAGERRRQVARALDALPREQRDLIEQAYFLGLTHSELARRSGLPLGTVKTRIRAGMLTLRERLQQTMIEQ